MNLWKEKLEALTQAQTPVKESEILLILPFEYHTFWDNFMRGKTCPILENGDHGVYFWDLKQFINNFNMQHIYIEQILFLTFQCVIVSILLLSLFRLRTIFGLSLLLTTLGVFQYMQVFLANTLYFEILPGFFVSSGSSILFAGS